jgi:heterodisulfide reductase subunit C
VLSSPRIWYCLICYRCYARCPQKVNFTDVMRALRYLAVKGRHAPEDILKRIEDLDRLSQTLRHDLIRYSFDKRSELLEAFRSKVDAELQGMGT